MLQVQKIGKEKAESDDKNTKLIKSLRDDIKKLEQSKAQLVTNIKLKIIFLLHSFLK